MARNDRPVKDKTRGGGTFAMGKGPLTLILSTHCLHDSNRNSTFQKLLSQSKGQKKFTPNLVLK